MSELMLALLAWIGSHTSYNTAIDIPNLVMTNRHNLCANYGIHNPGRCDGMRLQGFFNKRLTIYMRTEFNYRDPDARSRLLHELVHYVQWANLPPAQRCLGHMELEAYTLQDAWRQEHDLRPVLSDFEGLMLAASCED